MPKTRALSGAALNVLVAFAAVSFSLLPDTGAIAETVPSVAVGPQDDTTHVYVAPDEFDHFVTSVIATFGGTASKQGGFTVTPTTTNIMSQLVITPIGTIS